MLVALLSTILVLAAALLALVLAFWRVSRNIGPLDLEDYARRSGCVYIPVSTELAGSISEEWSKPVRMKIAGHSHPLLVELQVQTIDDKPAS
jgi:hypothetical protein